MYRDHGSINANVIESKVTPNFWVRDEVGEANSYIGELENTNLIESL